MKLEEGCELTVRAIEKEIKGKQYLVGDHLTLADLFVVSGLARGYQYVRGFSLTTKQLTASSNVYNSRYSLRAGRRSIQLYMIIICESEMTLRGYSIAYLASKSFETSQAVHTLIMMDYETMVR